MDMLFLIAKLIIIALLALAVIPIGFSAAVYFSLDRGLILVGLKTFNVKFLRVNIKKKGIDFKFTLNGKLLDDVDEDDDEEEDQDISFKMIQNILNRVELIDFDCALQFGLDDAGSTAIAVSAIKNMFFPFKMKHTDTNLKVFSDWRNNVTNLGARMNFRVVPLKFIAGI